MKYKVKIAVKVDIRDVKGTKKVEITGNESWLETLYSYFGGVKGDFAKLTASFEISYFDLMDAYKVSFKLNYTPKVDCSRCGIKIDWPISKSKELYFHCVDDRTNESDTVDLDNRDLDAYYVESGKINLEEILNETVHLAIPSQVISVDTKKPDECSTCGKNISDTQVFGTSKEDDPTNPFAALKNYKNNN